MDCKFALLVGEIVLFVARDLELHFALTTEAAAFEGGFLNYHFSREKGRDGLFDLENAVGANGIRCPQHCDNVVLDDGVVEEFALEKDKRRGVVSRGHLNAEVNGVVPCT